MINNIGKKKTCFVIMPFSVRESDLKKYANDKNHWTEVYEGLILPSVEKAGFICLRDDEDYRSRLITENIWKKIEEADIVLCNLSANNPNVYLELGWTLRADKKFILIKDDLTPFQFDLNQYYTFEYSHRLQPSSTKKSIDDLSKIIESTLLGSSKPYSIVRKISLELGAIEATKSGNVEFEMLKKILSEIRNLSPKKYEKMKFANRPKLLLFYHSDGTQPNQRIILFFNELTNHGIDIELTQHVNPKTPDSIYISEEASPELVRIVFKLLHYKPKYIFPINYPDSECGALTDFVMSIGLESTHRKKNRPFSEEPYKITNDDLKYLIEVGIDDIEFQKRLYKIAPPRK